MSSNQPLATSVGGYVDLLSGWYIDFYRSRGCATKLRECSTRGPMGKALFSAQTLLLYFVVEVRLRSGH